MKSSFFCRFAFASVLLLLSLTACGGGGGGGSTPSDSSLTVTVTGLTGLDADVTVTGPGSYSEHLTATRTLTGLARGTYTITAKTVVEGTVNRYPLKLTQTVAVNGADTATVYYPAATLTVKIPVKGTASDKVPMDFVLVPAGSFTMGSGGDTLYPHTVTISNAFYVAKTELTQTQWKAVMGASNNPSASKGDTKPVERVRWYEDIQATGAFMDQLNAAVPQMGFRLPSEAEWEYVCRAGTTSAYFFGADASNLATYAVCYASSTASVASKAPNPWGLYDILGNVQEWTEDDYHTTYYSAPQDGSAWVDHPRGIYRMVRGSYFNDPDPTDFRSAFRAYYLPTAVSPDLGFRLVMPVPAP